MIELSKVTAYCLKNIQDIKKDVISQRLATEFDFDFEITYALFLSSHIDGNVGYTENRFSGHIGHALGWSEFYASLLTGKIHNLPSYQLEDLSLAKLHRNFGIVIYKMGYCMALVDGDFNTDERIFVNNLKDHLFSDTRPEIAMVDNEIATMFNGQVSGLQSNPIDASISARKTDQSTVMVQNESVDLDDCMKELDRLIGLSGVKQEIRKLVSFLKIQKKRQEMNLSCTNLSLHMVFTGSPGTGKTTVARLVAKIYKALGFLKKGHLVETDRTGLVGQYVGHTESKTSEVVNKALDGILFIDEAYSLYKGSENDFGQEAIDTLVKRIEDYRDRLVVIVAGYEQEMQEFIEANPGLRSRFNTYIQFKNYSASELLHIFECMNRTHEYHLDDGAKDKLLRIFDSETQQADRSFGNGRFARNLFEKILRNQALRLSEITKPLSREDLVTIKARDIHSPL